MSLETTIAAIPAINESREQKRVNELIATLLQDCTKPKKSKTVRKTEYTHAPTGIQVLSWAANEFMFYKDPCPLPTHARGLFTRKLPSSSDYQIVVRGYNKFFNIGETTTTRWDWIQKNTTGPYEITLKENGCIIFVSGLQGELIVTSKHSLGKNENSNAKPTHAQKGEEWLEKHLSRTGKTRKELAEVLEKYRLTAVFELADDDFEEHVLPYPPERRGLHLHGLNMNTVNFQSLPSDTVKPFAEYFGFHPVLYVIKNTIDEVQSYIEEIRSSGVVEGIGAVEGFVVRTHTLESSDFFFKVKFDEPYLMYREWRECTQRLLSDQNVTKIKYPLTRNYLVWVKNMIKKRPDLFREYKQQKGIIKVRDLFLEDFGNGKPTSSDSTSNAAGLDTEGHNQHDHLSFSDTTKILLVPIATIASGKSTTGKLLSHFFGFGHIQNDNITVKKRAAHHFENEILNELDSKRVVFADRNNHLSTHRKGLCDAVSKAYPDVWIVALNWEIPEGREDDILDITAARVEERGENHQSLTPERTHNYRGVLSNFIHKRDPFDPNSRSDRRIDEVIHLDIFCDILTNFKKICSVVCPKLGLPVPSDSEIERQLEIIKSERVTVFKEVRGSGGKKEKESKKDKNKKAGKTKQDKKMKESEEFDFNANFKSVSVSDDSDEEDQAEENVEKQSTESKKSKKSKKLKSEKPRFYGASVKLPNLVDLIEELFQNSEPDQLELWNTFKKKKRIPKSFHITLVFLGASSSSSSSSSSSAPTPQNLNPYVNSNPTEISELENYYSTLLASNPTPPLLRFTFSKIHYSPTLIAIPISNLSHPCINPIPHITIATISNDVKPIMSNEFLGKILNDNDFGYYHTFDLGKEVEGEAEVKGFWY
ncbi:RNA ligase-domain-containing protein [Paraphysoderma sedebokerense]|nr:RNA ligase-domain-containing protein [Paraphysoderma sedebokerense]